MVASPRRPSPPAGASRAGLLRLRGPVAGGLEGVGSQWRGQLEKQADERGAGRPVLWAATGLSRWESGWAHTG